MTVVLESRRDLTLANARRVAWEGEGVEIGKGAVARMEEARARFLKLIEDPDVVIYGVTSGYGQNAKIRLTPEERKAHARKPPIAASAAFGDPLPERVTRAIVFARLANYLEGHAAITPKIAVAVAAMLDGELPKVPARGQGGAGEIVSLSPLFHGLAASVELGEKDALSLVNGSPSASGLMADAALAAAARLELAAEVLALAAEGFNAPLTHFDGALDGYWNNPHDAWALTRLRALIGNGHGGARRPYQAPVSFRILPRMLGQAHLAKTLAWSVAEQSLQAVTDNPVLLPPDETRPNGQAISTGGYHNAQAPMAMDALTAAYANLIVIAERMSAKLLDGAVSLLPSQLGGDEEKSYLGCLPMAITGYEEEARMLAQATLLPGSESGGFGQNDVASPVFLAWKKQDRAGELLECALASLAPIALRAIDVTGRNVPDALSALAETIRQNELGAGAPPAAGPERLAGAFRGRVYG
ncbi:MAG: aromatic amino acid lyase [Parvibaculaceae bacterium]